MFLSANHFTYFISINIPINLYFVNLETEAYTLK